RCAKPTLDSFHTAPSSGPLKYIVCSIASRTWGETSCRAGNKIPAIPHMAEERQSSITRKKGPLLYSGSVSRMTEMSHQTYVIAEIGINHCGDLNRACELIDLAKKAGANAAKFQSFKTEYLVRTSEPKMPYQVINDG